MSLKSNEPHHVAEYAYVLCQEFNRFYSKDKIISDDTNEITKMHKLFIVNAFYETIRLIFHCLGIDLPIVCSNWQIKEKIVNSLSNKIEQY